MTTKTEVLQAIRANCIECSGGSLVEVRECVITRCPVYPFRMATDPNPARGGKRPAFTSADDRPEGYYHTALEPTEQQEWHDYDPDC